MTIYKQMTWQYYAYIICCKFQNLHEDDALVPKIPRNALIWNHIGISSSKLSQKLCSFNLMVYGHWPGYEQYSHQMVVCKYACG